MKSILLHIYEDDGLESRLQAAFDLARTFEGHLTCLHATPFEDYLAADPFVAAALPVEFSKVMRQRREELRARIEARLAAEGMSWDWVHADAPIAESLIRCSTLADVTLVSLCGPALVRAEPRALAGPVAIAGRAPVLAIPQGLDRLALEQPVAIAWNGSPEAAMALRGALALLAAAPSVHLVEIEEALPSFPRERAARYLSRHGIHAEIVERGNPDGDVAGALRQAAIELGAGLLVMGAYGQSRLREFVLGGTTRQMLDSAPLPLLLAH